MSNTVISEYNQFQLLEPSACRTAAFDQDYRRSDDVLCRSARPAQPNSMLPAFVTVGFWPEESDDESTTTTQVVGNCPVWKQFPANDPSSSRRLVVTDMTRVGDERGTTQTRVIVCNSDPWTQFFSELDRRRNQTYEVEKAYHNRIVALKDDAMLDEIPFRAASERDFWEFMRSIPFTRRANVVVTDSGNLRAVWRGNGDKHVGLQFLGDRWVEYVIWTRRTGSTRIAPKAGQDTLEGVQEQIRMSGLASFLSWRE